ncbi:MAG: hypothetical protein PVI23_05490 [Maricaulaceae bacterium]|jgi:flagellar motility protein MotE (MotC chaperone)
MSQGKSSFGKSSRIFALVAVSVGGLAALKSLDVTNGAIERLLLGEPAYAAEAAGHGEADDHAQAADPRGPLDLQVEDEMHAEVTETAAVASHTENACPATTTFADRSGMSRSELEVLQSLSQRRRDLDAREGSIVERESLLAAAEAQIEDRLAELRGLEARIGDLLGQLDEAEETQIMELVGLYGRMGEDEAAAIFLELDEDVLLDVASRMNEQALAPILAEMPASEAARLTMQLARRHRAPQTLDALEARVEGTN